MSWWLGALGLVLMASAVCALVGAFIHLNRMTLLADAVSHSVLPGIVAGYLVFGYAPWGFALGALAAASACTAAIGFLKRHTRLKEDACIGIVYPFFFAAGVVGLGLVGGLDLDPGCVVYGEALAAKAGAERDVAAALLLAALVFGGGWRAWALFSLDPTQARLAGLPTRAMQAVLLGLLAWAAVAVLRAVGLVLAVALFVAPPATAARLTRRLGPFVGLSLAVGLAEAAAGFALALPLNATPAGVIAALGLAVYAGVALWSGRGARPARA